MNAQREKTGLMSGKLVLLALLAMTIVMAPAVWVTQKWVRATLAIDQPPLSWDQRAFWPSPPIRRTTLEKKPSRYGGPKTNRWRAIEFAIAPEQVVAISRCAALAELTRSDDRHGITFADLTVRDELEALGAVHDDAFYPPFLIGTWHRQHGNRVEAERYYEQAFTAAPAVIKQQFVDIAGQPVAGLRIGTIEISFDRVIECELDQTLKLVYPHLVTDVRGFIYLPVYHTVCRFSQFPEPKGYRVQYRVQGWFEFPGRIGTLKPAVVSRLSHSD